MGPRTKKSDTERSPFLPILGMDTQAAPPDWSGRPKNAAAGRCSSRDESCVVIALGDRCQIADHLSPMLAAVVAAPHFTGGCRREE